MFTLIKGDCNEELCLSCAAVLAQLTCSEATMGLNSQCTRLFDRLLGTTAMRRLSA